jgi:ribonuclease P protein component
VSAALKLVTVSNNTEFSRVYKRGKKAVCAYFSVHFLKRPETDLVKCNQVRFGFTLKKKTIGSAVERNLLKRRLKEGARDFLKKIEPASALSAYDIVITPFTSAKQADFHILKDRLIYVLNRNVVRDAYAEDRSAEMLKSA